MNRTIAKAFLSAGFVLLFAGCLAGRGIDPRTARFSSPVFAPPLPLETKLSGGVPVFLLEEHDVPLVRVYLVFRGGSLYDPPETVGLSEVAELAWRTGGAGDLTPEAFDEGIESRGMTLSLTMGRSEGGVSLSVLPQDLEAGLDLLAAIILRPAFRSDRVRWAVTQVSDRIRREVDDSQTLAFRELRRTLYRGHPRGAIPTVESVKRVTRAAVVALHRRLIQDGEWIVGAVGDFESGALGSALEARFGALPARGRGFPPIPPPPNPEPRLVLVPKDLPHATVVWARLAPSRMASDYYPLEILDDAVGSGGFQSRLVSEIRSKRGLAYSVGSFYQAFTAFGVMGAYAGTQGESVREVLELLRAGLREVARDGLGAQELERTKEALLNRHVFRYDDVAMPVTERMGLLLDGLPMDLPARYPVQIRAVTPEHVATVARSYYDQSVGVTVVVGPVTREDLGVGAGPLVEVVELDP